MFSWFSPEPRCSAWLPYHPVSLWNVPGRSARTWLAGTSPCCCHSTSHSLARSSHCNRNKGDVYIRYTRQYYFKTQLYDQYYLCLTDVDMCLPMNGKALEYSKKLKNLGLTINKTLGWIEHVTATCNRVLASIYRLKKRHQLFLFVQKQVLESSKLQYPPRTLKYTISMFKKILSNH